MRRVTATIVTEDYLDRAILMHRSMNDFAKTELHVLVVGEPGDLKKYSERYYESIRFYSLANIKHDPVVERKIGKYGLASDSLRWGLKPDFLRYLIAMQSIEKVLCLDCDLYFVNNFDFLYYDLEKWPVLITPHWRTIWPHIDANEFEMHLNHGICNAGFFAASDKALDFLAWWSKATEYKCEINTAQGLYVDQRYLDLAPFYFPEIVKVLQHQGCNVAIWNTKTCRRHENDGEILINGKWPIVFIHMSSGTIQHADGNDRAMLRYIEPYLSDLEEVRKELAEL